MQERSALFKNRGAFRPDDIRRRRDEQTVELRRQTRVETMAKRRNILVAPSSSDAATTTDSAAASAAPAGAGGDASLAIHDMTKKDQENASLVALGDATAVTSALITDLPPDSAPHEHIVRFIKTVAEYLYSNDTPVQYDAAVLLRKLLSREVNPPIQEVIKFNIVPRLVEFMSTNNLLLQFESAWILTNIASGTPEQTSAVVEAGAVPVLIGLINSKSAEVSEQAIWTLGNIAGDRTELRDELLILNIVPILIDRIRSLPTDRITMLRTSTWLLNNLCRGKHDERSWSLVAPALPTLSMMLHMNDTHILTDTCWALSYLSDGPNNRVQAVLDAGVARRLIELLDLNDLCITTPALRTIGNIVTGDDDQTQVMINCNVLSSLHRLLIGQHERIVKEVCWTVSNITAGNHKQIKNVIEAGIVPRLVDVLCLGDFRSRREACWAISNAAAGSVDCPEIARYLVECGVVRPLGEILNVNDNDMVNIAMEAIECILQCGEALSENTQGGNSVFLPIFEAADIPQMIARHLASEDRKIYECATRVYEKFFSAGDEIMPLNNMNSLATDTQGTAVQETMRNGENGGNLNSAQQNFSTFGNQAGFNASSGLNPEAQFQMGVDAGSYNASAMLYGNVSGTQQAMGANGNGEAHAAASVPASNGDGQMLNPNAMGTAGTGFAFMNAGQQQQQQHATGFADNTKKNFY